MGVVINLLRNDGTPWTSRTGHGAREAALLACLHNPDLSSPARELIYKLSRESLPDISIQDIGGELKLVCKRPRCKITISLKYPNRRITKNAFERLVTGLVGDNDNDTCGDFRSSVVTVPSLAVERPSLEAEILAVAAVSRAKVSPCATECIATHYRRHGRLPPELT